MQLPLVHTELAGKFDILVNAAGGGIHGQAGAAKLGIARALVIFNAGTPPALAPRRIPDARPARQGTEEVRPKGRAQAVPVLETVEAGVRFSFQRVRQG